MSRIDPNAVPSSMDQRQIAFIKHPEAKQGILKYDKFSLTLNVAAAGESPSVTNDHPIQTFNGKWTGDPDRVEVIEEKFLKRPQPFVGTCSRPIKDVNMGCLAHNGCPYPDPHDPAGRGPGPFNVIIEKDGQLNPCPCYLAYHGVRKGFPTAQNHYLYSGWRIDTDVTTTPSVKAKMDTDEWGNKAYMEVPIECPVDRLGPMYGHHFGKRKQKVKAEASMERGEDSQKPLDWQDAGGSAIPVNSSPGTLRNAPPARNPGSVKFGG